MYRDKFIPATNICWYILRNIVYKRKQGFGLIAQEARGDAKCFWVDRGDPSCVSLVVVTFEFKSRGAETMFDCLDVGIFA